MSENIGQVFDVIEKVLATPQRRNATSGGAWYKRHNINRKARLLKAQSHRKNLLDRAEINRGRSNNKTNLNFHGNGYHAFGKTRQQKRRTHYRNAMEKQSSTLNT